MKLLIVEDEPTLAEQIHRVLRSEGRVVGGVHDGVEAAQLVAVEPYDTIVLDIDVLLARNKETVARACRQASDLAHALKTPSAILRNELVTLLERGQEVSHALVAICRLDVQLSGSLARMRSVHSAEEAGGAINPAQIMDRLSRLFGPMCARHGKQLEIANALDPQV
ncbi:MAG: response regulator [Cypionkella sp.]